MSFFSVKYANYFRLYSIIFCAAILFERYILWDVGYRGEIPLYGPSFYSFNYIRIALIVVPFIHASFIDDGHFQIKGLRHNLPFFFLCLFSIALPLAQIAYFTLFLTSCIFIKNLRLFGIVLFLCCALTLIVLFPNYIGTGGDVRVTSVMANMHTFQTALETYAVDYKGSYPVNALLLQQEGEKSGYWKNFRNPVTGREGYGLSFADISENQLREMKKNGPGDYLASPMRRYDLDFLGVRMLSIENKSSGFTGQVLYHRISSNKYALYGSYTEGHKLIFERDKPLVLSNF